MAPKYTLIYFNGRGRGEVLRLLFEAAGCKYTDQRVEFADWPEEKKKSPQGSLPYLIIDGKTQLPQSIAIARYIARENNMYGKTVLDGCMIDTIVDTAKDMFENFVKGAFEKDEAKKAELQKNFGEEVAPKILGLLEKCACGKGGFLVGSSLSLADIYLYSVIENVQLLKGLDKYPNLKAAVDQVEKNAKIAAYLKKRPETQF